MKRIAHIENDMSEKFGIPRQSGLVPEVISTIVFEPEYRNPDALRGLEEYSHLWIIWEFEGFEGDDWSPTVRPPRLGGNVRMGVFATRSPNRPNPIGLSCVRIVEVSGTLIRVAGADLRDGTAILDVKPYLPFTDAHPDAAAGFAAYAPERHLEVEDPRDQLKKAMPEEKASAVKALISQDPRPSYHDDPARIYGMKHAGLDVRFRIEDGRAIITGIIKE